MDKDKFYDDLLARCDAYWFTVGQRVIATEILNSVLEFCDDNNVVMTLSTPAYKNRYRRIYMPCWLYKIDDIPLYGVWNSTIASSNSSVGFNSYSGRFSRNTPSFCFNNEISTTRLNAKVKGMLGVTLIKLKGLTNA